MTFKCLTTHTVVTGTVFPAPSEAGAQPALAILYAGVWNKCFQGTVHTTKRLATDNSGQSGPQWENDRK